MRAHGTEPRPGARPRGDPGAPGLVCKIGGSLLDAGWAPPLLGVLRRAAPGLGILVLAGGGRAADRVRARHRSGAVGSTEAHWEAVRALDVNALRLSGGGGGGRLPVVTRPMGPVPAGPEGPPPPGPAGRGPAPAGLAVLAPGPALRAEDPLPHGWHVTSDSIAAWAAARSGASRLVLLKARSGRSRLRPGTGPGRRSLPSGVRGGPDAARLPADRAVADGLVDAHLPTLLRDAGHGTWIVNGRYPERLLSFLTGDASAAIRLVP